jgi:hypothetical protein
VLGQVAVIQAGNVTFSGVELTCPIASNFEDSFGGLYGAGAYPVFSTLCDTSIGGSDSVLTSSLEFYCNVCPVGTYSVFAGSSNGSRGAANNSPCRACPSGAQCVDTGTILATQDHWGASDPAGIVSFVLCPAGYCNSAVNSSASGSARTISGLSSAQLQPGVLNACAGQRTGPLCSDCSPGYVDALGSTECSAVAACTKDKAEVWPLIAVALLGSALVQLVFVSAVWSKTRKPPSATLKLAMYFFQVGVSHAHQRVTLYQQCWNVLVLYGAVGCSWD